MICLFPLSCGKFGRHQEKSNKDIKQGKSKRKRMGKRNTIEKLRARCRENKLKIIDPEKYVTQETIHWFQCECSQYFKKDFKNAMRTKTCCFKNHDEMLKRRLDSREIIDYDSIPPKMTEEEEKAATRNMLLNAKRSTQESLEIELPMKFPDLDFSELNVRNKQLPFVVKCKICSFTWETRAADLECCKWCEDRFKDIKHFDANIIRFVHDKIYVEFNRKGMPNSKYFFCSLQINRIYLSSKLLIMLCEHGHSFFVTIADLLKHPRKEHCPVCNVNYVPEEIDWYHNKERLIAEMLYMHPTQKFDFSQVKEDDLIDGTSKPRIICKNIRFGQPCDNVLNYNINRLIKWRTGCSKCRFKEKYGVELFIRKATDRYGDKYSYELITPEHITNSSSVIPVKCNDCQYVMTLGINAFLNGHEPKRCDGCDPKACRVWDAKRFLEESKKKEKEGVYRYDKTDPNTVENCESKIIVTCLPCIANGSKVCDFNPTINNHFNSESGCPRCAANLVWSNERFFDEIPDDFRERFIYDRINETKICNGHDLVSVGCKRCTKYFERTVCSHLTDRMGCTFCPKSLGAQEVYECLTRLNYEFDDEVPIDGMKNRPYRYDYVVFEDEKIITIIEYDGKNHFEPVAFFGGMEGFKSGRTRDIYKHKYAVEKGFKVIRIDYTIKLKNVEEHIKRGLASPEKEYFSTPSLYEWLKN